MSSVLINLWIQNQEILYNDRTKFSTNTKQEFCIMSKQEICHKAITHTHRETKQHKTGVLHNG